MKPFRLVGFIASAAVWATGCTAPTGIHGTKPNHVLILPGVAGLGSGIGAIASAVKKHAPDTSAQVYDWTQLEPTISLGGIENLTRYSLNLARAKTLANQLRDWRRDQPDVKLSVVGLSGGAGIALFACEELPDDFVFERMVLLSGAVSPGYDLTRALRMCRRGIVNYYSSLDSAVLEAGTTNHGTMDRIFRPSSGFAGFMTPEDKKLAAKLEQVAWDQSMAKLGNDGLHWGSLAPAFLREYVVPWLCGEEDGGN